MSFYSYSCLIGYIWIDLDFFVRTRTYEKRLTGKQPWLKILQTENIMRIKGKFQQKFLFSHLKETPKLYRVHKKKLNKFFNIDCLGSYDVE